MSFKQYHDLTVSLLKKVNENYFQALLYKCVIILKALKL